MHYHQNIDKTSMNVYFGIFWLMSFSRRVYCNLEIIYLFSYYDNLFMVSNSTEFYIVKL